MHLSPAPGVTVTAQRRGGCTPGAADGSQHLPVYTVDRVRIVMVPSLLVAHVNRQRCVERRQELLRNCGEGRREREREREDFKNFPPPWKNNFQKVLSSMNS